MYATHLVEQAVMDFIVQNHKNPTKVVVSSLLFELLTEEQGVQPGGSSVRTKESALRKYHVVVGSVDGVQVL